ncbi:Hypothetical predicted protein [Olea europaea subsp. europaea]|uniref:Transmembrane protein n=1 Tax=Olea europaea subsp. europaea TaxID=158383 RepID=A0A8S0VBK0_OLEEU|nr:Hypothetical predicted protein [Olea europaea subsp. europaea]
MVDLAVVDLDVVVMVVDMAVAVRWWYKWFDSSETLVLVVGVVAVAVAASIFWRWRLKWWVHWRMGLLGWWWIWHDDVTMFFWDVLIVCGGGVSGGHKLVD